LAVTELRDPGRKLRVGGLTALSTADWPGQLAAVVFCQGCPWRCGYCHNPHLLPARGAREVAWTDVLAFLGKRKGLLDAVVFSGGEPLAQAALVDALRDIRAMGFRVALHTAGAYPARLAEVLPLLDWVGFDIKAPVDRYAAITGAPGSGENALAAARMLIRSGVPHEFRTTVHSRWHDPAALEHIADRLASLGARRYVLQEFRETGCADVTLSREMPSFPNPARIADLGSRFESFAVRRA
jgi:pyruvate formate lyase activating enzyme